MLAGRLRVINEGKLSFLLNWIIPMMPRRAVLKNIRSMQEK